MKCDLSERNPGWVSPSQGWLESVECVCDEASGQSTRVSNSIFGSLSPDFQFFEDISGRERKSRLGGEKNCPRISVLKLLSAQSQPEA
jgi:hypothetical protein